MLKNLTLHNFKLFRDKTKIPLSNVNLLTGSNGRGKSTVLQTLLLMKQSPEYNRATHKIILNGSQVRLGNFDDIKNNHTSPSEPIIFIFEYNNFSIEYHLVRSEKDPTLLVIHKIIIKSPSHKKGFNIELKRNDVLFDIINSVDNKFLFSTNLFDLFVSDSSIKEYNNSSCRYVKEKLNLTNIHYVSADRIGPQNYYELKSLSDFISVGPLGEDTVSVLYHKRDDLVNKTLINNIKKIYNIDKDQIGQTVELQTEFWMDVIFKGAKVKVEPIQNEDLLRLRINSDVDFYKPTNVGYGYCYSLPIIVAGLIANPGEILIVENPEAHLHPYAQSQIAKFLALISLNGVQVFIESHSDHILNGLRLAVHEKLLSTRKLNVLFFNRDKKHFQKVPISASGGIRSWPPDFFDQVSKDLDKLLGI